jgi:secreted trypsin-like serine protease
VRRLILVLASIGVAVLLASGAALGITNGIPDDQEPYKYPNVGAMVDPNGFDVGGQTLYTYCTGTLISPTVFLTAAHCSPAREDGVTFDAKYDSRSSSFYSVCRGNRCTQGAYDAQWHADPLIDIAVVVFDEPIKGIEPARLPTEGQFDSVTKDQKFTAVGYGDQATSSKETNTFSDQRMYAYSAFKSVNQTYLRLSQNLNQGNGGTCYGDSGGPNFLGKGTYQAGQPLTIAGTTITGDTWCKATNVTLRLDTKSARDFLGTYVTLP